MLPSPTLNSAHFWSQLPTLSRLFALFLSIVALWTIVTILRVFSGLRRIKRHANSAAWEERSNLCLLLQNRLARLRQFHLFTLYLFVLCASLALPAAFFRADHSSLSPVTLFVIALVIHAEYAADVCLVLLFLHCLQWLASEFVQAFATAKTPPAAVDTLPQRP